ncbi:interleukin-10 receptor subunit beta-like [Lepisosteus oculatus]|uniref:Interleukin 10 receptor subunit beta n=1 Tax=Lepisosteus oculatus TaxID=7918 RepID=W5M9D3_LEPOC|nr:PREDICTED: interleukin-10 receptor subunit beta-like [Lepisosteus oculatus]
MSFSLLKSWLLTVVSTVVLASLPPPANVTLNSVNLGAILQWDYEDSLPNVTYTARVTGYVTEEIVCNGITEKICDFTNKLTPFGMYKFQVRAEQGEMISNWTETEEFSLDRKTSIGPPSHVGLSSREGILEVSIQDPVMKMEDRSLNYVYNIVSFFIKYWKHGEEHKAVTKKYDQKTVVLSELEPQAQYCVQVEVYLDVYDKRGEPSQPVCIKNTSNGKTPQWLIAVLLIGSFAVSAGLVVLFFTVGVNIYRMMHFAFPSCKLPEHFKQYLTDPPQSYVFLAMLNSTEPEELCSGITIVSEGTMPFEMGEKDHRNKEDSG